MSTPAPAIPASRVLLDHAASAPLRASARQAMLAAMEVAGNPSALHTTGRRARSLLEDAREQLADALGAHPTEVLLTSGGSESNTIAVLQGMNARLQERPVLVIGATEHPSVLTARERWTPVRVAPVDADGVVHPDALGLSATSGGDAVGVVSVQSVNNETGTLQPVATLVDAAHAAGAWFHTDAVQAPGHVPFDFAGSGADMASLSAHKFGGPVGAGVLLVRRSARPAVHGLGGRQEGGIRSGTPSLVLAAGMAAAAADAVAEQESEHARLALLRARLVDTVRATIDQSWVNGGDAVSPAIANITFAGTRADDVLLLLDRAGIDASTGAACRAGVHQPSDVLLAMGHDLDRALASVRFSFGPSTRADDVDALLAVLPDAVSRARAAFPASSQH